MKVGLGERLEERVALVFAELLEVDPNTGERLDYIDVAGLLEGIRDKYSNHEVGVDFDYHIIGFAKVIVTAAGTHHIRELAPSSDHDLGRAHLAEVGLDAPLVL